MSDQELLELAAKAAGMTTHRYCEAWKAMALYSVQDGFYGPSWNPLADDGDALRLAVKLNLFKLSTVIDVHEDEPNKYAAARRAIVRAAAEIGKETRHD